MAGNVRVIVFGNVSQSQFWGTDRHCKITRPVSREQRLKKEFVHRPGPGLPFPPTPDQTHSRRGGVFPHCRSFFAGHMLQAYCAKERYVTGHAVCRTQTIRRRMTIDDWWFNYEKYTSKRRSHDLLMSSVACRGHCSEQTSMYSTLPLRQ